MVRGKRLRNWAGNLEYSSGRVYAATTLEQVQDYVRKGNLATAASGLEIVTASGEDQFNGAVANLLRDRDRRGKSL
jgi:hypothetical protein